MKIRRIFGYHVERIWRLDEYLDLMLKRIQRSDKYLDPVLHEYEEWDGYCQKKQYSPNRPPSNEYLPMSSRN